MDFQLVILVTILLSHKFNSFIRLLLHTIIYESLTQFRPFLSYISVQMVEMKLRSNMRVILEFSKMISRKEFAWHYISIWHHEQWVESKEKLLWRMRQANTRCLHIFFCMKFIIYSIYVFIQSLLTYAFYKLDTYSPTLQVYHIFLFQ